MGKTIEGCRFVDGAACNPTCYYVRELKGEAQHGSNHENGDPCGPVWPEIAWLDYGVKLMDHVEEEGCARVLQVIATYFIITESKYQHHEFQGASFLDKTIE